MLKPGTRIELHGTPAFPGFPGVAPEMAVIVKPRKGEGVPTADWHIVKFADGGTLCIHEANFRVVDNR